VAVPWSETVVAEPKVRGTHSSSEGVVDVCNFGVKRNPPQARRNEALLLRSEWLLGRSETDVKRGVVEMRLLRS
jgi:hypothetical protein